MKKGFSLLEVLIATAVLGIAMVSLVMAFSTTTTLKRTTEEKLMAEAALRRITDELKREARVSMLSFVQLYGAADGSAKPYEIPDLGFRRAVGWSELGEVQLYLKEVPFASAEALKQNLDLLGTPNEVGDLLKGLDMNGDGDVTDDFQLALGNLDFASLNTINRVLVRVRIAWRPYRNSDDPIEVQRVFIVTDTW